MPDSDSSFYDESEYSEDPAAPGEDSGAAHGNRPADGARQVSPGEAFGATFDGSASAGDFLGLDVEVNDPVPESGGLELTSPSPYGASHAENLTDDDHDAVADDGYGVDEEPPDEEGFLGDEEPELDEELYAEPVKSKAPLYAGLAFAVGLLAVGGAVLGPKYFGKQDAPTPVATNTRPRPTPVPTQTTTPDPVDETPDTTGEVPVGDPVDTTDPSGPDLVATTTTTPADTGETPTDGGGIGLGMDLFRRLAGGGDEGEPQTSVSQIPGFGEAPIESAGFDPALFSPEAWMSGELVDMVWRDASVPMEAIAHPARVMTPRVGYVRVHLDSGEALEGRLYAVGQNRVWLEGEMGRLGLDGDRVVRFERVHVEVAQNSSFDSTSFGTGKRVRVKVPGGVLYGRVLSVVDENVTLITDGGARVSLHAPEIEPLGPSRAIMIER